MLKNELLPCLKFSRIMARTTEMSHYMEHKFRFKSAIRGYHLQLDKWKPEPGDRLLVVQEPGNKKDKSACLVKTENLKCVGHIPYEIAHICFEFLEHGSIAAIVTGKRRLNKDSPTRGLEIPCTLTFRGPVDKVHKIPHDIKKKRIQATTELEIKQMVW